MPGVRLDELHHQCISSLNAGKEPVVGAQEAKKKGPELRQFSPAKVTLYTESRGICGIPNKYIESRKSPQGLSDAYH